MANNNLSDQLNRCRRAGVPLVAVETPDPASAIRAVRQAWGDAAPIAQWDLALRTRAASEAGEPLAAEIGECDSWELPLRFSGAACEDAVAVVHGADVLVCGDRADPLTVQAVWHARDACKAQGKCLVLLGASFASLSPALRNDVVVLEEPLPDAAALDSLVRQVDACHRESLGSARPPVSDADAARAVEAVQGLSAFLAEQALAMALNGDGYNMGELWGHKRKLVSQTRGLSVHRGGESFADLGGLGPVKADLRAVMAGRRRPAVVCWIDEIGTTGLAARQDTSGVNQDQEGTLLSWMEDRDIYGVFYLGPAGTGKSAMCKACGGEFGVPTLRVDLGAMQGSLVGESQRALRDALRVIEAVAGDGRILAVATSNSVDGLSAPMRSRFTDTFFFDLPTAEERRPIWDVWLAKHPGIPGDARLADGADEGWVGRNIRQCVAKAWERNVPLAEAARHIVPVGSVEREEVERLRGQAAGRFLSASQPGVYRLPEPPKGRKMRR